MCGHYGRYAPASAQSVPEQVLIESRKSPVCMLKIGVATIGEIHDIPQLV